MVRGFLAVIGALYLLLSLWCTLRPMATAKAVGFTLSPGSGQSEFLVVYGGLQMAMGLVFLLPLLRPDTAPVSLLVCVIIHGSLVAFRVLSFVRYSGIDSTTYALAGIEAAILLAALILWLKK